MQWKSKASFVNKRKTYNTIFTNPELQNYAKNISSISDMFHLFISNSMKQGSLSLDTRTAILTWKSEWFLLFHVTIIFVRIEL